LARVQATAEWVRENSDVLLVVGVGGSYAGAFAGMQLLGGTDNSTPWRGGAEIAGQVCAVKFIGTSFDPSLIVGFLTNYRDKRVTVNIVSKSGTTLEIIATFNIIEKFMREKYPEDAEYRKRIILTTSDAKGYLREYADKHGVTSFSIPDGVGGRYSVLSDAGYLPLAVAGIDVVAMQRGAADAYKGLRAEDLSKNEAYKYAVARYLLHTKAMKSVEVIAAFNDGFGGFGRWWQQLFGESEGKNGKGLLPTYLVYSRDLHSMGQFIQQGSPIFFETFVDFKNTAADVKLNTSSAEPALRVPVSSLAAINRAAQNGTIKAHTDAGVPIVVISVERLDAYHFGYMSYFFEVACAMSAFLLEVNPFDQPGVEFYKKNMRVELKG
jgi:glucose-6-phosphate isomerase